jgi:hypothetical protein
MENIPLVTLTPMASQIDHCALVNSVTTSFTLVRSEVDLAQGAPLLLRVNFH